MLNNFHHLANGSTRSNHIVDYQDATLKRRAHHAAALAMILGLFSIKTVWHIKPVLICQRDRGRGSEGNALVSRAKQHIKLNTRRHNRRCVTTAQFRQCASLVKLSCIKKVRRNTPRLERKLPKLKRSTAQAVFNKLVFITEIGCHIVLLCMVVIIAFIFSGERALLRQRHLLYTH